MLGEFAEVWRTGPQAWGLKGVGKVVHPKGSMEPDGALSSLIPPSKVKLAERSSESDGSFDEAILRVYSDGESPKIQSSVLK